MAKVKVVKAVKKLSDAEKTQTSTAFLTMCDDVIARHSKGLSSAVKLEILIGILNA